MTTSSKRNLLVSNSTPDPSFSKLTIIQLVTTNLITATMRFTGDDDQHARKHSTGTSQGNILRRVRDAAVGNFLSVAASKPSQIGSIGRGVHLKRKRTQSETDAKDKEYGPILLVS